MKKILHITSQVPGKTGSGVYLQALVKEASKKKYKQCVVAGIPSALEHQKFLPFSDVQVFPVLFDTGDLPFHIPGMSDVMPYPSTQYAQEACLRSFRMLEIKKMVDDFFIFAQDNNIEIYNELSLQHEMKGGF